MRFAVIGPLEVRGDDEAPVPVPGAKERLLLAVLTAGAPGVVPTDRITDVLWDGAPPPTARKSLQAHVVRLRSALEPGRPHGSPGRYVARRGPGYALTVDRSDVDALHVGDLAARGRAHLAAGAPAEAEEALSEALRLWRGEPYADWPDAEFAAVERRRLAEVRTGVLTGLHEARLALGRHAEVLPEAERLVAEDPLQEDRWRLLVLALYRSGRQADALAALRRVRGLLAEELGASPGPALRGLEAAVLAQDPALDLPASPGGTAAVPSGTSVCPYKGLAAYRAEDAPLFRGRRRLVATLVARLVDAPMVVVSGPSGAGKSSAVRAGLVPALTGGALPGGAAWRPVVVTPGRCPVDVLAPLTGDDGPVLLVVDQTEELWAPGVDPGERTAFLDAVLGLLDDGVAARCVLVLRGDVLGRLAEHAAVTARLDGRVALVPALTDAELREVVREPAAAVGLTVEDDLVDAVVADGLGRPAALPLLSTALVGTWERRRGGTLTLAGYLAAGGLAGALTRSAEAAWAQLDGPGQELARGLLVRLADDAGGVLVRRPLPLAELDAGDPARRAVVDAFVARRLLSLDEGRLEVAHEALLTAWPRLAAWLEEDAAGRAVRRHLAPAASDWDAAGRPDDELYRGARLAAALDWADRPDADPTPVERAFLDASRASADAELLAAHERADREAAARRRTRWLAVGLAAVLVAALVTAGTAVRSQLAAQRASLVADANRLAVLSTSVGALDLAFLLAAQAVRLAETPDSADRLLTTLIEHRRVERVVATPPGDLLDGVLAGDATLFLRGLTAWVWSASDPAPRELRDLGCCTTALDGSPTDGVAAVAGADDHGTPWLRLLTADGEETLSLDPATGAGFPLAVSVTADGRRIRVLVERWGDPSSTVVPWSVVEVDRVSGATTDLGVGGWTTTGSDVLQADFGDEGTTLVTWTVDAEGVDAGRSRVAVLSDLTSARQVELQVPDRAAQPLGFRALGSGVAQLWSDGAVTLYGRDGAVRQELDAHRAGVADVEESPDGTWAVTVGGDPGVALWEVDPASGDWTRPQTPPGHEEAYVTVAEISPDGGRLFTAAPEGLIVVRDMRRGGGVGDALPTLDGRWVAGRPEVVEPGRLVVVPTRPVSRTGGDTWWEPAPDTRQVSATFLDPGTGEVVEDVDVGETPAEPGFPASVAVSPDRRRVAVTSGTAVTVLDTATRDVVVSIPLPANGERGEDGRSVSAGIASCAEWTPDGSRLVLCTREAAYPRTRPGLSVVDLTGEVVQQVRSGGRARVSTTSPDGRLLAVGAENRAAVSVLDASTLVLRSVVELQDVDRIEDLAFSGDGRRIAVAGANGVVAFVDTAPGETSGEPVPVGRPLVQVDWASDSRTLVAAGRDGTVALVDADRRVLRGPPLPVSDGAADGHLHLLTTQDEVVAFSGQSPGRRFPLESRDWLAAVCAMAGRDLTAAEWGQYLPGRQWQPTCTDLP
ncbi:BTAD domain-containing putative transcriptional regulator [Geodermatophilus sp. SYSU D01062]